MKFLYALPLTLLFTAPSFASDVLNLVPGSNVCESVKIAQSASLSLPTGAVQMGLLGYGLRAKKVAIVNVKVYCLSLFSTDPSSFVRTADDDAALKSTDAMKAVAFRLDFVRGVDAATVSQSFSDALRANDVDLNDSLVQAFLNAVASGGDAQSGGAITIAGDEKTGTVIYQDTNGATQTIHGTPKLVHQIVSIWLGNPDDSGLKKLKSQLIGN